MYVEATTEKNSHIATKQSSLSRNDPCLKSSKKCRLETDSKQMLISSMDLINQSISSMKKRKISNSEPARPNDDAFSQFIYISETA